MAVPVAIGASVIGALGWVNSLPSHWKFFIFIGGLLVDQTAFGVATNGAGIIGAIVSFPVNILLRTDTFVITSLQILVLSVIFTLLFKPSWNQQG